MLLHVQSMEEWKRTNSKLKLDESAFFRTQSYITELCYFKFYQVFLLDGSCLCDAYMFMHINYVSLQYVYM